MTPNLTSDTIDITTPSGVADCYLTRPATGGPFPGVIIYMDAYGLRPALRAHADRLAGSGYSVFVPNVFYRDARSPVVEDGCLPMPAMAGASPIRAAC